MTGRLTELKRAEIDAACEDMKGQDLVLSALADRMGVTAKTVRRYAEKHGFEKAGHGMWRVPLVPTVTQEVEPVEHPEIERARQLREAAPVVVETPMVLEEREFIDTVDSWIVQTPEDLQAMADMMQLNIEVRVWRTP